MTEIQKIRKRSGEIVDYAPEKIKEAMRKAFSEVAGAYSDAVIDDLSRTVTGELEAVFFGKIPSVEDAQDAVERALMKKGFHAVAKAYILYRYEHAKQRERVQKAQEEIEDQRLRVVDEESGEKEVFSETHLRSLLDEAVRGYENDIDKEDILRQVKSEIFDGISTKEILRSLIMSVRSMIERDPAYSKVAARLLLDRIYKEVFRKYETKNLATLHAKAFPKLIKKLVSEGGLDARMTQFDLEAVAKFINVENDKLFDYMGLEVMYGRYLMKDAETEEIRETPQMLWLRVAMGTALNEKPEDRNRVVKDFYDVLSEFLYTPGGRTLFLAGMPKAQLSSCFLNTVPDSLDSIFKTYADNAQLLKWSGGTGTDWTNVRATGSLIKGTGVGSQGVIPFLKIANDVTVSINRSGKRRGAACVYLESWHYDIVDFLELRKNTGDERRRTHDISTANWIPDLFMKRVREDAQWTLFSPDETPDLHDLVGTAFEKRYKEYEKRADKGEMKIWKKIQAKDLWRKMLSMLYETGHPWITFKDASNVRSPQDHCGVVHSSNLCTEITLNTSPDETAVCNLGSINFAKLVKDGSLDVAKTQWVVETAVRMLDNVIDINYYPTEDSKRANLRHRPIGLGVRGFHDALYMMGINFDSDDCVRFADESMEIVAYHAIMASSKLAKERGKYQTYKGSKWDRGIFPQDTLDLLERERSVAIPVERGGKLDWKAARAHVKRFGMRNSNTMAIAPTASTANLVGCIPSIEPIYKNLYVKSNKEGNFIVINEYLVRDLKAKDLWNDEIRAKIKYHDGSIQRVADIPQELRDKYKEAFEIDSKWLIKSAAYRGKWIDQSQSLNIFFQGTSGKAISDIYFYAWEMGLKTTYYLRTLAITQVEKSTVDPTVFGSTHMRAASASAGNEEQSVASLSAVGAMPASAPKACSLEDPTCEACQG